MLKNFELKQPELSLGAYVAETALVLGDVHLGVHSSIWPMAVVRGDVNYIRIGDRTNIQDGSVLHVTHAGPYHPKGYPLLIGNEVTVGHKVILHGCQIADHCLIGMGACIMDGATVMSQTIIGAGSLVPPNKILESGYLWVGSPAKKVRALTASEIEFLTYSAEQYVQLKNRYLHENAHPS